MRAQAHTLEAFTAALLLLSAVLFVLQATAVTPLSASTSNQHIENQERAMAMDLLSATRSNESVEEAILYWNGTDDGFAGATDDGTYSNGGPPNEFGQALNRTFGEDRIAYNVFVRYWRPDNSSGQQTMVYMGKPSDNAVAATTTVVVFDDDRLTSPGGTDTVADAASLGEFYAPDAAPNSTLFNVVEVRIVVWRM